MHHRCSAWPTTGRQFESGWITWPLSASACQTKVIIVIFFPDMGGLSELPLCVKHLECRPACNKHNSFIFISVAVATIIIISSPVNNRHCPPAANPLPSACWAGDCRRLLCKGRAGRNQTITTYRNLRQNRGDLTARGREDSWSFRADPKDFFVFSYLLCFFSKRIWCILSSIHRQFRARKDSN